MKVSFSVSVPEEDARRIVDLSKEFRVSRSLIASAIIRVGLRHRGEVKTEIRKMISGL